MAAAAINKLYSYVSPANVKEPLVLQRSNFQPCSFALQRLNWICQVLFLLSAS